MSKPVTLILEVDERRLHLYGKKFVDGKVLFSRKKTASTNQKRGLFKIGI